MKRNHCKMIHVFVLLLATLFAAPNYASEKEAKSSAGMKAYAAQDFAKAMRLLRPLADSRDALALLTVGRMFDWGEGVSRDRNAAERYYSDAVRQGNIEAKYLLALMRLRSHNLEAAKVLFEEAATEGNQFAKYELAALLANSTRCYSGPLPRGNPIS